jgi:hypothetical protein
MYQPLVEAALDIKVRVLLWTPALRPDGSLCFDIASLQALMVRS